MLKRGSLLIGSNNHLIYDAISNGCKTLSDLESHTGLLRSDIYDRLKKMEYSGLIKKTKMDIMVSLTDLKPEMKG